MTITGQFIIKYRIAPTYDSAGNLCFITDHLSGETTMYRYDLSGKLVHSYVYDNESMRTVNGVKLRYDDESRLTEESFSYDYNHASGSATDNYRYLYEYHETMGNVDRMQIFGVGVEGNLYYNYDFFELDEQLKPNA